MRLLSLALIAALSAPLPVLAAPTQGEIAAARLAYIDGDYDRRIGCDQRGRRSMQWDGVEHSGGCQ